MLAALHCIRKSDSLRGGYVTDRALIVAALIIGGAFVAASIPTRARYALSAADSNIAWRMDTWSGQIDICTAAYLPNGPVVRCGVFVAPPVGPPKEQPSPAQPGSSLESAEKHSL
jgi:hypothetical protein